MGGAEVILGGDEMAVKEADLNEAITCRLAHFGRPERVDDREHVDAGGRGGAGFFGGFHEKHGHLTDPFEGANIGDGGAGHGGSFGSSGGTFMLFYAKPTCSFHLRRPNPLNPIKLNAQG
ncbi:hypothetical protein GALL_482370 [mine drainage metagenome]|uniref:Uncharacterized protein n=1 Tax=mine drainage metagenome TaxID=410659 RepID=A0A1J5PH95_9ZZZZ